MAPEQLAADPAADHRIDIYAVGLLAYELLSGQSPFVGTSPQATMAAQLTRVPDPLDSVRDDVPPALAAVIMRCLEKLPEKRPQTATALLDELDGVVTPASGGATATVQLPAAARTPDAGQRRAFFAGAMLVIIAGVAVAVTTWSRRSSGGPVQAVTVAGAAASAAAPTVPGTGGAAAIAGSGANRPLVDSAARTPIVLSRAESLAIAEAVRNRIAARRDSQVAKGEQAFADSLSRRFERALSDSLARLMTELRGGRRVEIRGLDPKELEKLQDIAKRAAAMPNVPGVTVPGADAIPKPSPERGPITGYRPVQPFGAPGMFPPPPLAGVRRVLIGVTRLSAVRRELAAVSGAISDSIHRAIAAQPGYDVVDAAALTDPRVYVTRTRTALARAVGAGALVTGLYFPRGDSLVVLQLQVFDVRRNRVMRVLESKPLDQDDPTRGLGDLVTSVVGALNEIDWRPVAPDSLGSKKP
jgi:serine/threonine-protein kinase